MNTNRTQPTVWKRVNVSKFVFLQFLGMPYFDSHQNFGVKNRRRFKMATFFSAMVNPTPSKNMTQKMALFWKMDNISKTIGPRKMFLISN